MLFILLGILVALLITGAVIDIRTRRRKARYRGLDAPDTYGNRDNPAAIEGQMRTRITGDNTGNFGGF